MQGSFNYDLRWNKAKHNAPPPPLPCFEDSLQRPFTIFASRDPKQPNNVPIFTIFLPRRIKNVPRPSPSFNRAPPRAEAGSVDKAENCGSPTQNPQLWVSHLKPTKLPNAFSAILERYKSAPKVLVYCGASFWNV